MTEHELITACEHLAAADPVMAALIARVGPCTLEPHGEPFIALARSIVGQQISVQAAATIWSRFSALYEPEGPITPSAVLQTPDETLCAVGLSRAKAVYVKDLAARFVDGAIVPAQLPAMTDEEIIEHLTRVKGIGRWTAEMFLIFSLCRPDVLPVYDLGFRTAVQRADGLPERPAAAYLRERGERWRPYRTVAT